MRRLTSGVAQQARAGTAQEISFACRTSNLHNDCLRDPQHANDKRRTRGIHVETRVLVLLVHSKIVDKREGLGHRGNYQNTTLDISRRFWARRRTNQQHSRTCTQNTLESKAKHGRPPSGVNIPSSLAKTVAVHTTGCFLISIAWFFSNFSSLLVSLLFSHLHLSLLFSLSVFCCGRFFLCFVLLLCRCCCCVAAADSCVVAVAGAVVARFGTVFRYLHLCSLSLRQLLSSCQVHSSAQRVSWPSR